MKNILILLAILCVPFAIKAQKITLSSHETLQVKESNVFWKAELDSTSEYTVINASSIAVMNASFPKEKNITKQISFKLKNENDEGRTVNSKVTGLVDWNGQQLYTTELEIGINLTTKWEYRKVNCVLADLTEKEHKLLVGKNWLGENIEVK
ncbi:MAG: hypothetical protein K9G41_10205 [Flavobacteriales bacterium]|nr:hypothetical protein [Flavobacteriales bacterium]